MIAYAFLLHTCRDFNFKYLQVSENGILVVTGYKQIKERMITNSFVCLKHCTYNNNTKRTK